ncbi:hypothetical protein MferCBS31731_007524 [Microsporum ferrugineum]
MPLSPPSASGPSTALPPIDACPDKMGGKSGLTKSIRSSSWSTWLSASMFHTSEAQDSPISKVDGQYNEPVANPELGGETGTNQEKDLHKPVQSDEHKKFVTIDEPIEETGNGTESDTHSDTGTVRRPKIPGSNIPPKFLLSPESLDNHRSLSLNDIDRLPQEYQLESHTSRRPNNGEPEDRTRQAPGPRRTSRTVSRDDCLKARGANPRTGVVSPALTDESCSDGLGAQVENLGSLMNNQKWRLKGDQWISIDASERTPLPTPSTDAGMNRSLFISSRDQAQAHVASLLDAGVPLKSLEDRFVVNMPSAREPCPPTMTPQQIADFQQACNRFYRYDNDMVDPERAPSPRPMTPEGPSTPPKKLYKIREALLQSTGPFERGHKRERPPVHPYNPRPQSRSRQWRHSSAPPTDRPRHGQREQTNKSFLDGGRVCGREDRLPAPQKMRRYPPATDLYRPTGHYGQRGPQEIPYRNHRGSGMPSYPQDLHPRFRSSGPARRQNFDGVQDRRVSRDIYFEPQSHARQTIQLGPSDGDDLLATITTTTTTSTVTPIRLNPSDMESYFTPTEVTSQKSSPGQSQRASGESIATTATKTGNVGSAENVEDKEGINQPAATHNTKSGRNAQGADGLIPILGTQGGEIRNSDEYCTNWLIARATSFTKYHLIPMAIFYLTLAAMTCREYHQYLASRMAGLNTPQGLRSMQVIGGVLFMAVAISVIPRSSAKASSLSLQDMV